LGENDNSTLEKAVSVWEKTKVPSTGFGALEVEKLVRAGHWGKLQKGRLITTTVKNAGEQRKKNDPGKKKETGTKTARGGREKVCLCDCVKDMGESGGGWEEGGCGGGGRTVQKEKEFGTWAGVPPRPKSPL